MDYQQPNHPKEPSSLYSTERRNSQSQILLDAEWDQLARRRRSLTTLANWARSSPQLGLHDDLNGLVAAMRTSDRQISNRYWNELLVLANNGDDLARRLMLQVVVPALEAEIGRWHRVFGRSRSFTTRAEIEQQVYAAAFGAIRKLERRNRVEWPVLDILRETRRQVTSYRRPDERWADRTVSIDDNDFVADRTVEDHCDTLGHALQELVDRGQVSEANASLILQTRSGQRTFDDLAAEYGTSADTLRRRRHRTEQSLSGALAHAA